MSQNLNFPVNVLLLIQDFLQRTFKNIKNLQTLTLEVLLLLQLVFTLQ